MMTMGKRSTCGSRDGFGVAASAPKMRRVLSVASMAGGEAAAAGCPRAANLVAIIELALLRLRLAVPKVCLAPLVISVMG